MNKKQLIQHRKEQYEAAIQKVIDGKAPASYATERWLKYQQALGKKVHITP